MTHRDTRFLAPTLVVGLVLRLFKLGSQSLWIDEILTVHKSIPQPGLNIWDYVKYNLQGPLHSVVVYVFHFVSTSDFWLRVPSALAGTAALYFTYRWLDVWLDRNTARIATAALAIHPLHIHYSQELRNYGFLLLFAALASWYLHRLLAKDSVRDAAGYTWTVAAAALSNFTTAFLYAVHSVLYLVRRGIGVARILRWVVITVVVTVLVSPWLYRIHSTFKLRKIFTPVAPGQIEPGERMRGETSITPVAIPYAMFVYSVGFTLGPSTLELHDEAALTSVGRRYGVVIVWVGLVFGTLAVAGLVGLRRRGSALVQVLLYLLIPFLLLAALCWQNARVFNVRYILISLPVWVALLAVGLQRLPRAAGRVAGVLAALTLVFSLGNYYFNGKYAKEDMRGAAAFVDANATKEDCVLAPTIKEVFEYYFAGPNEVHAIYSPGGRPRERVDAELDELSAACATLWYIRGRGWVGDPEGYIIERLGSLYPNVEESPFHGVRVMRYSR